MNDQQTARDEEQDRLASALGLSSGRDALRAAAVIPGADARSRPADASEIDAPGDAEVPPLRPAIVLSGTPEDDVIQGTEEADTLRGLAGNDQLFGLGGVDDLFGAADNDILRGGGEADSLFGQAGRDQLFGDAGIDRLVGGLDGDFYFVDSPVEVVDEDPGGGVDQVRSPVAFALPAEVEVLALLGAAISGTGNELDNTINGTPWRGDFGQRAGCARVGSGSNQHERSGGE
jgi:Ca2+-binding RTX toxin-like protein